ncbi:MAG TPA: Clp protease N-terminal domain-containing protein, partial [Vampirovibrionales bacterium]
MFEYFTEKSIKAIMLAQQEARRLGHNFVGTEQLLLGLIAEGTGIAAQVLKAEGVTLNKARVEVEKIIGRGSGFVPVEIPFTPRGKSILEMSLREASQLGQQYIATEHLLLALTQSREGVAFKILENLGVSLERVRAEVIKRVGENPAPANAVFGGERGRGPGSQKALQLSEFGVNLTEKAMEGTLDPVVGRKKEIERIIQILGRRTKNNPVLVGEPGVGKTALAEGLAQRIANQDVPETLKDKQVFTLDMGSILAGTRFRGDFEERIKMIMEEVRQAGNIILVIDEIHTLVGAGSVEGGMDAANLLKPALARGEFQCIGATTLDEYRKHIERD